MSEETKACEPWCGQPVAKCGASAHVCYGDDSNCWCSRACADAGRPLNPPVKSGMGAGPAIDWSKWLPPAPLPDTGPKEFRVGQVWAVHYSSPRVLRIKGEAGGWEPNKWAYDLLAGGAGTGSLDTDSTSAARAILVQDVGQPEPTHPHALFGTSAQKPAEPATQAHWPGTEPAKAAEKAGAPCCSVDGCDGRQAPYAVMCARHVREHQEAGLRDLSKPATPAVIRREVSQDGKHWIDYSRLVDADPYEAYPFGRCQMSDGSGSGHYPSVKSDPGPAITRGDAAGAAAAALVTREGR